MITTIDILGKKGFSTKGIIHIGAHLGEEAEYYNELGFDNVLWIEGNPNIFVMLQENISKYKNQIAFNALLSEKDNALINFYIANNDGHSSSILDFDEKLAQKNWNGIAMQEKLELTTIRFETFIKQKDININKYNFLNIDVQGAELIVLKGIAHHIENFDYVILEVNLRKIYKESVLLHQLDCYMLKRSFVRISSSITGIQGEALYAKTKYPFLLGYRNMIIAIVIELFEKFRFISFLNKKKNTFLVRPIKKFYKLFFQ